MDQKPNINEKSNVCKYIEQAGMSWMDLTFTEEDQKLVKAFLFSQSLDQSSRITLRNNLINVLAENYQVPHGILSEMFKLKIETVRKILKTDFLRKI